MARGVTTLAPAAVRRDFFTSRGCVASQFASASAARLFSGLRGAILLFDN